MVIPIPTTLPKYFRQCLEIIRIIPPLNTLRPKELDVLAGLLYEDYKYSHLAPDVRSKIVFDYTTKMELRDRIHIDEQQFNNCLTSLRKKGILKKRGIETNYGINPDKPFITFEFKIKE